MYSVNKYESSDMPNIGYKLSTARNGPSVQSAEESAANGLKRTAPSPAQPDLEKLAPQSAVVL